MHKIYEMLDELGMKMKSMGYKPTTMPKIRIRSRL
jgi:hypothetical protein